MPNHKEEFEILEQYEQGKVYTIQDALKKIAEQIALSPEGFIEAEEREDGLFQVTNTAFYLRRVS